MGFYSEENCQTEAHEPLLDWASGPKAPVLVQQAYHCTSTDPAQMQHFTSHGTDIEQMQHCTSAGPA